MHNPPPQHVIHALTAQGHIAAEADFHPMAGGRSNLVWRVCSDGADLVLKLYVANSGNPLFPNSAEGEARALSAMSGTGLAPRLIATGHFNQSHWLLYAYVKGTAWASGSADVAHLLHRVHATPGFSHMRLAPNGSAELAAQGTRFLTECNGATAACLRAAKPQDACAPTPKTVLLHGDPVPGNIIRTNQPEHRLILIDWQCPAAGDPCEDIAIFLSPAMQYLYRGTPLSTAEIAAFCAAYKSRETIARYQLLRPWFHWRMACYCLWRSQTGSPAYKEACQLEYAAARQCA